MAELTTSGNSGRKGSSRTAAPRIDLTAMVDLAFLLITFFIMATSLAKPKAMDLAMPIKGTPDAVPETRTMSVCLGRDNKVMWYMGIPDKPLTAPKLVDFSKTGLRMALITKNQDLLRRSPGKPLIVILKPGEHAVYANFVAALDELNITNIQSYSVADITPKDIDMLKQQGAF